MRLQKDPSYSFINTIAAHGWSVLRPFEFDTGSGQLRYAFEIDGRAVDVLISDGERSIRVSLSNGSSVREDRVTAAVAHILRIDEDFGELHAVCAKVPAYRWIGKGKYGPMLRSATVFEDLVKTICTTNCSWGLTKTMVGNLVALLGAKSPSGRQAFPGAAPMARESEDFYAKEIRAGYRGPYLRELSESVASGKVDPESWLESDLPSSELKKEIKKIKGVGDYAAEHLLKLIGRYDGLALDSYLRSGFYAAYNRGNPCPDRKIEGHYERFGTWKGLVIWFDMLENAKKKAREKTA